MKTIERPFKSFDELLQVVLSKNPAGLSDVWVNAARYGWERGYDAGSYDPGKEDKIAKSNII